MPSNLAQLRIVDPVLTSIAQGYAAPELIGTQLLPIVLVTKEGGHVPSFGKEAFMQYATQRAPRGKFQRMDFGVGSIPFTLEDHGIEVPLDQREVDEARDTLDAEAAAAETAQLVILRRLEREIADLVSTGSNYAGNTQALSTNQRWSSSHADSQPIKNIEDAKEVIRGKTGVRPNVLVLGPKVFAALKDHSTIQERIKYTKGGVVTTEILASVLGVERVLVGDDITSNSAGTLSDTWGKIAILAVVPGTRRSNLGTPAFGYTLRKNNYPSARKYWDDSTTSHVVQVQDIRIPKILGPGAGFLYTTVVA